jgi:hypothetical protein
MRAGNQRRRGREREFRILCVHQGYELYGSDRCFLDSVATMRRLFPAARIDVLLPQHGPLAILMKPFADNVAVTPLWVIRKRRLGRLLTHGMVTFPLAFVRAIARFRQSDIVYINTITVLDYIFSARFFRHKAILHVHELPSGMVRSVLGALVRAAGIPTIFNSKATREAFSFSSKVSTFSTMGLRARRLLIAHPTMVADDFGCSCSGGSVVPRARTF